ncbi:protein unc-13 homolog [Syzygium oleosum]|uniref:protein unc-13 homolog n=1 Tax=Syzygium oleosum TaxID=219896 RepID=UPI0011D1BD18|nr:protein unc-13 homolog [Syzygium oleosum]
MAADLEWPFGELPGLEANDIRETAYEMFFMSCRSSPGFGGRSALMFHSSMWNQPQPESTSSRTKGVGMAPSSRIKRTLGLKMLNRTPSKKMASGAVSSPCPQGVAARPKRPLTSAELMRQQMRVTEQSDNWLRKTLTRTHVGHIGKRAETIILPLELLRHLKPSEFNDSREYHAWQKRQLKILEAGLILHPSIPLETPNTFAVRLKEIIQASETKILDIGENSDTMRSLSNSVVSLSWRSANGTPTDVCHWADGFPLNIHLYVTLLQSIFDIRDETLVLDEVDELLELMKKTWLILGINRPIHNLCLTWVFFQQYVSTMQLEPELLFASHAMLAELANDAKKQDRDALFIQVLSLVLTSIRGWSEKRLGNYHDYFEDGRMNLMENLLPFAVTVSSIGGDDVMLSRLTEQAIGDAVTDPTVDLMDGYIRSSVKNAFSKMAERGCQECEMNTRQDESERLIRLAKETKDLALKERGTFSPVLRKCHPVATSVAAVTLHSCYGLILKQHLTSASVLDNEIVTVLESAGKLEKVLAQLVVEDTVECEDGGKMIVREMIPYEVESTMSRLQKQWIEGRLKKGKDCLQGATESEKWNPKSKAKPYAESAEDLIKFTKETMDDFFAIRMEITEDLVHDLVNSLGSLFQDYAAFVASCGSKQNFIPVLPPLTRCRRDSKFAKLCRKVTPCKVGIEDSRGCRTSEADHPHPSMSRGTQHLYIRLNTLHYLLAYLHSLDEMLSLSRIGSLGQKHFGDKKYHNDCASYFQNACSAIREACQHVSEVAAHCLIFVDSNHIFYNSLYIGEVASARIRPTLRTLKQNLSLLCMILIDQAQPLAMREVMKASFDAYLMVLLAGGNSRIFYRSDHRMIEEDFECLKRSFCVSGEGLMSEDVVEKEAETVEMVIALMSQPTDKLIQDISVMMRKMDENGAEDMRKKQFVPPTTEQWSRSDPNTILRVLCHRNDQVANRFLKRTFQIERDDRKEGLPILCY